MAGHQKSTDASQPPFLQSRALRVFLQLLALSVRNILDASEGLDLLDRLEGKLEIFRNPEVAEGWGLSPDDVVDLFHLARLLKTRWNDEFALLAQKQKGPPH